MEWILESLVFAKATLVATLKLGTVLVSSEFLTLVISMLACAYGYVLCSMSYVLCQHVKYGTDVK